MSKGALHGKLIQLKHISKADEYFQTVILYMQGIPMDIVWKITGHSCVYYLKELFAQHCFLLPVNFGNIEVTKILALFYTLVLRRLY